jgi:signal transduction histidine kinase
VGTLEGRTKALALFGARVSVQWYTAALIALSNPWGGAVFSSLLIFTSTFYGHVFRTGARYPFGVPTTLLAIVLGACVAPSGDHIAIFIVSGLAAVVGNVLLGTFALRADGLRARSDQLRAAVAAQILNERAEEVQRRSSAFTEVIAFNHDISNALAGARLNADILAGIGASGSGPVNRADFIAMVDDICAGLSRVKRVLHESRRIGRDTAHPGEVISAVEIAPVVQSTFRSCARRFPSVSFHADAEPIGSARVLVRGGAVSLERVLENVIVNACEGNGARAARNVTASFERAPEGHISVIIRDDGPGFPPEMLLRPIDGFETTKANGTGLGLYTAERLITASGGALVRANDPRGGAVVSLMFAKGGDV